MDREFGNVTYNEYSVLSSPANDPQDTSPVGTHLTVLRGLGSSNGIFTTSYLQIWRSDDAEMGVTVDQGVANIETPMGSIAWMGINGSTFDPKDAFYFDTVCISLPGTVTSELLYIIDANFNMHVFALNGTPLLAGEEATEQEAIDFLLLTYSEARNVKYSHTISPVSLDEIENTTQVPFEGTLVELKSNLLISPNGKFPATSTSSGTDGTDGSTGSTGEGETTDPETNGGTDGTDTAGSTDSTDGSTGSTGEGETTDPETTDPETNGGTDGTDASGATDKSENGDDEGDDTTQNIVGAVTVTAGTNGSGDGETTEASGAGSTQTTTTTEGSDQTQTTSNGTESPEPSALDTIDQNTDASDGSDNTDQGSKEKETVNPPIAPTLPAYNEITGSEQADNIHGTEIEDHIFAFEGNDTVYANGGNDLVYGNSGDDMLFGGDGNDQIYASDGDDLIEGGAGNDSISAGNGNDTIRGGDGDDLLKKLSGQGQLDGGQGADIVIGGYHNDHLTGGEGRDILVGDMSIFMGGADTLVGGQGDDILMGGIGADTFVFRPNAGNDMIASVDILAAQNNTLDPSNFGTDFTVMDRIHLVGFANIDAGTLWSHITDTDQGALFSAEGTTILFVGLSQNDLSVDHFVFG